MSECIDYEALGMEDVVGLLTAHTAAERNLGTRLAQVSFCHTWEDPYTTQMCWGFCRKCDEIVRAARALGFEVTIIA